MNRDHERLVAAATSAHRSASASGPLRFHPAFFDLDAAGRAELFAATLVQRRLEALAGADGLSATARAVLRRIRGD
ncbi:MAG: hypothetical protein JNK15_21860 [Planctomycetes bacterium]|nr:hypothetical protein [Planctomycetota bacterium]